MRGACRGGTARSGDDGSIVGWCMPRRSLGLRGRLSQPHCAAGADVSATLRPNVDEGRTSNAGEVRLRRTPCSRQQIWSRRRVSRRLRFGVVTANPATGEAALVDEVKRQLQSEMGLLAIKLLRERRQRFVELKALDNARKVSYGTAGYLGNGYFITVKHAVAAVVGATDERHAHLGPQRQSVAHARAHAEMQPPGDAVQRPFARLNRAW